MVDELLAQAAGKATGKWRQALFEFIGKMKRKMVDWLDANGMHRIAGKLDTFGVGETALLLKEMREAIADGAAMDGNDVAFMTAYHGSHHEHAGFKSEHIGSGEGAQAY
ncbi:MAG: hypothetical protein WCP86_07685, partial [bacterium]